MEIAVKLILAAAFTGSVFFFFGGVIQSVNAIVNKTNYNATLHWILASVCMGVLFFHYAP